ncbi:MAG: CAP domain-containing protein [Candidatus Electrothrix sp. GW3-4]|uniref:CAP domain-containing protein n=1 Tax=Candidatus Electrothrix sp. GW3-4 TaxID=3126740 RepID=UPI0030CF5CA9
MKARCRGRLLGRSMGGLLALFGITACTSAIGATSMASSDSVGNSFDPSALVAAHNKWRTEVGSPGLQWSDSLAKSSQAWADSLKGRCAMRHSQAQEYGENIYYAGPLSKMSTSNGLETEMQQISPEKVVDSWGEEKKWYDEKSNSCHGGECGHYTQVVWKDTSEVGCGMVVCTDKGQIWVCQYKKPGNIRGQQPY